MNNTIIKNLKSFFLNSDNLYLLLVSIGPVQEFIAEARKARDLWLGSYILSLATFKAMEPILKKYSKDVIIYPKIEENPFFKLYNGNTVSPADLQFPTLPNHFLSVVKEKDLKDLTDNVCKSVISFWNGKEGVAKKTHHFISSLVNSNFSGWDNLWDAQINDHFQTYWVAVPITLKELESKNDYIKKHDEIQRLMAARKLTRTFNQWQGNRSFKCFQCGHREVIGSRDFYEYLRKKKELQFRIKENEKLCAVCFVKRLAKENDLLKMLEKPPFESTSDISSKPFKEFIQTKKEEQQIKDFFECINKMCEALRIGLLKTITETPGDWLYEEGLRLKALKKEFPSADDNEIEKASIGAIRALKDVTEKYKFSPSKYYAILMLDGDKMGEKISELEIDGQAELSIKIGNLGNTLIPKIIGESKGYPIYSGGDDMLAFLPLEKSLSTAYKLRDTFIQNLGNRFTCSVSLVIVHHQDSLRKALEEARKAMVLAKEDYRRDAMVITLMLSSGAIITGGSKWYLPDSQIYFTDFLIRLVGMMKLENGALGNQFIYDILKELPAFYDRKGKLSKDMFESEVKRLLDRHTPQDSILRQNSNLSEKMVQSIISLGDIQGVKINVRENLQSILRLSAFYVRENIKEL